MNEFNLDPNDGNATHILDIYSEKWGNQYYELRPGIGFGLFGAIEFKNKLLTTDHDTIVSIPMYCKMTGLSLNEIEYEYIKLRLNWNYNHIDFFRDLWMPDWFKAYDTFAAVQPEEDYTFKKDSLVSNWKFNWE